MTECEKLDAGLEYDFWDDEVNARKANAMVLCKKLNALDPQDQNRRTAQTALQEKKD